MGKWKMVRLGEVATLTNGYAFDSRCFTESSTGMPVIRIRDVVRGYTETYTTEKYSDSYVIQEGDLLIGMDGGFNIAQWKSRDALLNQRVCKIQSSTSNLLDNYLLYYLPQALKDIEAKTPFVTVKHLSSKTINAIQIPLPPLDVQQKIADVLDKASALIELRRAQLDKLDLLIKSRFIEMFGDPVKNPMGWPIMNFKDVCSLITDGEHATPRRASEGIYLLSARNVLHHSMQLNDVDYIDEEEFSRL